MNMYWYKFIFGFIISIVLISLQQTYMYMSHIMNDCTRRHPMAGDVRVVGIEKHTSKIKLFSRHGDGASSYSADNKDTVGRGYMVSNNIAGDGDEDDVDFRVIVLGYNRAASLQRLLDSINNATYYGARTTIEVWLDKSRDGVIDNTLQTALRFSFRHGEYKVFTHQRHVGIYGQWLSTWQPSPHSPEIAVILEDDLVVSPHYYRYLKLVHAKYGHDPHVNGFALQGYSIKHMGQPGHVVGPSEKHVFLYPTIGTWGFSPNRKNWINFLEWFSLTYTNKWFQPCVKRHISTTWYRGLLREGRANSMWSMWHIYYAWKQDEFTLYPNLEGQKGLTVNCKEPGLHHDGNRGACIPLNGLLTQWKREYEHLPDNPPKLDNSGTSI